MLNEKETEDLRNALKGKIPDEIIGYMIDDGLTISEAYKKYKENH